MKKHRITAGFLLPALLLTGCGGSVSPAESSESEAAQTTVPEEKILVTLGDSISAGYGLDTPETERYSALLKDMLEAHDNCKWQDCNYAVSGDDSSDLIERLNTGRAVRLPAADAIVLYIGANNVLGVYTGFLKELTESVQTGTTTDSENDAAAQIPEIQDREAVLQELDAQTDANLKQLVTDLDVIYNWIRERNADADIYVLNLYNPYQAEVSSELTEGVSFRDYAQERIDRVNKILSDFTQAHDDLIPVDIASAYAKEDPVPVLGAVTDDESAQNRAEFHDPHPNTAGQKLIAETVYDAMTGQPAA